MKKANLRSILSTAIALALCLICLIGCNISGEKEGSSIADGGVICLKVNPEIAITYDADGNVTKVDSRNEDAKKLLADYTGYEGKDCKTVVSELVTAIGNAGYFVEEIEGERRQITIEIETGSKLPSKTFLDDVANEVRACVNENKWESPVDLRGESDYGITDYIDTDYGEGNDGVTDYTDYGTAPATKAPAVSTNEQNSNSKPAVTTAVTTTAEATTKAFDMNTPKYDDTDYGPNNDGITDYTDYGTAPATKAPAISTNEQNNNGKPAVTTTAAPAVNTPNYGDTDYGPNNDGITDYDDTDYGSNNDGVTDYDDTDYGRTDYDD